MILLLLYWHLKSKSNLTPFGSYPPLEKLLIHPVIDRYLHTSRFFQAKQAKTTTTAYPVRLRT